MKIDRLYCVQFGAKDADEIEWSLVCDEQERVVPAAYVTVTEAEHRRSEMSATFPEFTYRVVGFEHSSFVDPRVR